MTSSHIVQLFCSLRRTNFWSPYAQGVYAALVGAARDGNPFRWVAPHANSLDWEDGYSRGLRTLSRFAK
jgi:hypothetical protein